MSTRLAFGEFELRPDERRLLRRGEFQTLGSRAFDLLLTLLEHRDRVVGKDELMALVWPDVVVEENNLTVQISALRKLLGADAIATVPGRGYRFTMAAGEGSPAQAPSERPRAAAERIEAPAPAERPSIAVLPFEARTDDAAIGYLADGLVEDVIALLARVPGFLVIARSSSFEFRPPNQGLSSIARQLGVRYLVEGSVRQLGTRLLVATHLVEAESARVLWSGRMESERESAQDLQETIARGIMSELEPELTRAEIRLIRRRHPDNVDAWGHYHRAVGALGLKGWNEASLAEARSELEQALAIDRSFALAGAFHALTTVMGMVTGLLPLLPATAETARQAAEQALALEDGDSQVLGYVGCALCDLGQRERGVEILRQALDIDPSNAQAHVALGATLAMQGQPQAGTEMMRHGMRISPRDRRLGFWGWALSHFLQRAGRPEDALIEARASAGRDTQLHLPRIVEAAALQALGRSTEAAAALAAARRLRPGLTMGEVEHVHGRRLARQIAALWSVDSQPEKAK
ncbi:MAG: winged helix-turn-helix domain-containing protein [Rubrivivax sp.]|nr:winged helix-turn-helix domain-containing protein [Rubrivivax sp.]